MVTFFRYWHTLRYLRPVQFYGRLWFRFYRPKPDLRIAPALRPIVGSWVLPAQRRTSMVGARTFCFLNETHDFDGVGWESHELAKLWLYNLHYFDDLNASSAPMRRDWHFQLLRSWVSENLSGKGTGWEPYPTSLRIVNWVKWVLASNELPPECLQSLAVQARWLAKRLEFHLLGNHLFVNAKALVFAGLFFNGSEADGWLKKGLRILEREVREQVLPDGGHFERSTMYHALALEDILDLINAAEAWPRRICSDVVNGWREVAGRMVEWMQGLLHPDGGIAFFNDAAFGIAPEPSLLLAYADQLGIRSSFIVHPAALSMKHLPESGYIRLASPDAVALLDVAPVGPDYLPGHAHSDTLSFELSLFGQRVIVNGGTSCYGAGPARLRERQTCSHSTVEVAGESSSEVWSSFRVARRAFPFDLQVDQEIGFLKVVCSHDGYTRLSGKPVHRRSWVFSEQSLLVKDKVGGGSYTSVARFIVHPSISIVVEAENFWLLTVPGGRCVRVVVRGGSATIEPAWYAPEFGKILPTQSFAVVLAGGYAETEFIWS